MKQCKRWYRTVSLDSSNSSTQELDPLVENSVCVANLLNRIVDEEEREANAQKETEALETAAAEEASADTASMNDCDPYSAQDFNPEFFSAPGRISQAGSNKKLDLHLLVRLVNESLPVLKHVKHKDVVLLLGNTGVGKSLLIQAVAGGNVQRRQYLNKIGSLEAQENSEPIDRMAKWVWDVDDPVPGFAVGHDQVSETKHIRHYIPESNSVVYLDAPG